MKITLKESVQQFVISKKDYYKQWIFEEPILISKPHNDKLIRLQKIMYKLIQEFVTSYDLYRSLMPLDSKTEYLIQAFNKKEYKIGTYRTDFVYDNNQQVKLIEITCRFALNGMFLAALMNEVSLEYPNEKIKIKNQYEPIYKHLERYLENVDSIAILKGEDIRNESKIYIDIFTRMGYPVEEISYKNVNSHIDTLGSTLIISELSFDEILSFSENTIEKLVHLNIINDFRTIFLIHDKRFFSVLGNKKLQKNVLSNDEISFFEEFYIPTYTSLEKEEIWEKAKKDKNSWILKHRALGKSQKIYAGLVTEENVWSDLFSSKEKRELVLQEWVPQKKIKGRIAGVNYDDFVTGTLLFFDNNYYGLGDFRTSSYPVTNKVDHRKATSLIRMNDEDSDVSLFNNYIN